LQLGLHLLELGNLPQGLEDPPGFLEIGAGFLP